MMMSDLHRYMWLKVSNVNVGAAETQESTKGPSPPQIAPKQSGSTSSTPNPVKAPFPLGTPSSLFPTALHSFPSAASLAAAAVAAAASSLLSASCSALSGIIVENGTVEGLHVINELFLTPWLAFTQEQFNDWMGFGYAMLSGVFGIQHFCRADMVCCICRPCCTC